MKTLKMTKEKKPNIARVKNEEKLRRYLLKKETNGKADNQCRN
jgi:hypothetical protein